MNKLVVEDGVPEPEAIDTAKGVLINSGLAWDGSEWKTPESVVADSEIVAKNSDDQTIFGWAKIARTKDGKVLVDREGDAISVEELEKGVYDYVLNSRDGGEVHVNRGIGTVIESMVFTKEKIAKLGLPDNSVHEGWWIGFQIHDAGVWEKIKKDEYTSFSVHGTGRRVPVRVPIEHAEYEPVKFDPKPIQKSALVELAKRQRESK